MAGPALARFSKRLCVDVLERELVEEKVKGYINSLELVQTFLPAAIALHSDLNTAEYLLFAAFEVYSELDDIAVIDGIGTRLHARAAEAYMVEKCAGTALDVLYEPLSPFAPQLAVPPTDNFTFETDRSGGEGIAEGVCSAAVSF